MKQIISLFIFFVFLFISISSAFSFNIDGVDSGVEWDGASVYKLIDGESNCGINYGLVKVKFDHESSALCLCFQFLDSNLQPDNINAGISISVEDSSPFEITVSDGIRTGNITPYSFDGAISVDKFNGATCEIRIGIKSGLPQLLYCKVRFIDSEGYYSNYYDFTVENEEYIESESNVINPTADNSDPVFNPDYDNEPNKRTSSQKTTAKKTTTKKYTTKPVTKPSTTYFEIKTSPPYSYTGRTTTRRNKTEKTTDIITTKSNKTNKVTEKVYIYEKEVYISKVFITEKLSSSDFQKSDITSAAIGFSEVTVTDEIKSVELSRISNSEITLSKGTKYKKIISGAAFTAFIILACFGAYSAKKNKFSGSDSDKKTEE